MIDQDNNFYLISLGIVFPFCWIMLGYFREKLLVNHLWELKGLMIISSTDSN